MDSGLPAGWINHADATSETTNYHNTPTDSTPRETPPTSTIRSDEERRQLFFRTTRIVLDGGPHLLLRPLFRARWNKCFPGHEWDDGGDVESKKRQGENFFYGPKGFLEELWTEKVTRGYDHFQLTKDRVKEWAKKVTGYANSNHITDEDMLKLLKQNIGENSLIDIGDTTYRVSKQGIVAPTPAYYWRVLEFHQTINGEQTEHLVQLRDSSSMKLLWKQQITFGVDYLELKKKDVQEWAVEIGISADSTDEEIWETFCEKVKSIDIKTVQAEDASYEAYPINKWREPWQIVKLTSKIKMEGGGMKDEKVKLRFRNKNENDKNVSFVSNKNKNSIGDHQQSIVLSGDVNAWDSTLLIAVFTKSAYSGLLMPPITSPPSYPEDPDWEKLSRYVKEVKDIRNVMAHSLMESMDQERYNKCKQSYLGLAQLIDEFIEGNHMDGEGWKVENTGR